METENEEAVKKFDEQEASARENAGDMEVQDAIVAKARHYCRTGDWDAAYAACDALLGAKKVSAGKRIDATLQKIRVALFLDDATKLKSLIAEAKVLVEAGGDWDRRNRLKTYEAIYLLIVRDVKTAAKLMLDCVATFTASELFSYEQFMFYVIVTAIASLTRGEMKEKMMKNPQVLSVIREMPLLEPLLTSIYGCEYKQFFEQMVRVYPSVRRDRYLGPHTSYILREYRIVAYRQFLEAYKSVMLSSMATSFGIGATLMDTELARFIASGRLNAKIDKVGDVVETVRPEAKTAQYLEVIKKGDGLLTNIQKLARSLDV